MAEENERKFKRAMGGHEPTEDETPLPSRASSRSIPGPAPSIKMIATHTVKEGETLGSIALKYYGSASEKFYLAIYEANKSVIGDNPNRISLGMALKIPEKPEN